MGSKNKLKRFKENEEFKNVFQPSREDLVTKNFNYKGSWNKLVFKNNNPIVLELGCGKGEYSVGLAKMFPKKILLELTLRVLDFGKELKFVYQKILIM